VIKGLLDERLRDGLHQKLTVLDSSNVGAELEVMGQIRSAKDFLGKEFELRKTFAALRPVQRGQVIPVYRCRLRS
jgi:hypothetical protein